MKKMFWCRNCNEETPHEPIRQDVCKCEQAKRFGLFTYTKKKKIDIYACMICRCERPEDMADWKDKF